MRRNREWTYCYCLFCRSGAEYRLRDEIEQRFEGIYVLAAEQEKHMRINHSDGIGRRVFLPGYLFLYTVNKISAEQLLRMDDVYRLLGNKNEAELQGSDRAFAEWLWENGGVIGLSRIRFKEGKLEIVDGPLRSFSDSIVKVDKHTRNALVRIKFLDQPKDIWLAFDFEDEL